ncbi:hypothetical protein RCJ22_01810, partial [Vibrio sp. FNV 38]|nr:hypothetical protein [Vibrio sp. FNV 38]
MRRFILSCIFILSAAVAFGQTKGFEKSVEATGGIGLDKYQKFTFGVNFVGGYRFNDHWDVSAAYSNVQYIAGIGSSFASTAIFNTGGVALHYRPVTSWDLAAGYSYTRATQANG